MGADIHVVIESQYVDSRYNGIAYLEWDRCTKLFVEMGCYCNEDCRYPSKGFPIDASTMAINQYALTIMNEDEALDELYTKAITKDEAEKAVGSKKSHYIFNESDLSGQISDPGFCFPSTLGLPDLEKLAVAFPDHSYYLSLTINIMKFIESGAVNPIKTRIVYWFDI